MADTIARMNPITCEMWLPRGPDLPCEVLRVKGCEKLSEPYKFEIEIWCDDPDAPLASLLGADAELLLERGGLERAFHGIIAELDVRLSAPGRGAREGVGARLQLVPAFALLEHEVETRFFTGQSVIEILSTLLGARLGAYERSVDLESRISGNYHARDYCVQFRESTFAFCSRLMAEEGIAYFFEPDHEAQRERMVLVDANEHYVPAELLVAGPIAIEPDRPEELDRESVQSLDMRHAIASNRVVTRGYNYKLGNPVTEGEASQSERRSVVRAQIREGLQRQIIDDPVGDPEASSFDGSALDQQVPLARRMLESLRSNTALGQGRANAIGFAAGTTVELEQALAGGTRQLLLTRVEHHVQRDTGSAAHGCSYHADFEFIPSTQVFRPLRAADKPRVRGVQTGVVVGKKPDEVHTDRLGRVQVVFPLLERESSSTGSAQPSCWIRVAQVWAGQGYGAMVIPRVGMEVVVSFVDGDPDQPLITGCVYNATNMPPYPLPEELSRSTFKSSSTPGGEGHSELRIEDAEGSEQVFVRAQRRMDLRVSGTLFETATGGCEATVGTVQNTGEYTAIDARTIRGDVHELVIQDHLSEIGGKTQHIHHETLEAIRGTQRTWVMNEHQLNAESIALESSDRISQKSDEVILSGSSLISMKAGERLVLESNNAIEMRVGQSFISLHQGGIDIQGGCLRLNSGGGVGSAKEADSLEALEIMRPFEALPADDGRGRGGGGGGGGGRQSRSRGSYSFPAHSAPPMKPAKLEKPKHSITALDEVGRWVEMAWTQPDVFCSEDLALRFVLEGVPVGAHQSGFVTDAASGELIASFGVSASADRFDHPTKVCDLLPRKLPGGSREASRELNAQLSSGLSTPAPIKMRFITDLRSMLYEQGGARFTIRVRDQKLLISHLIPFVRGWMGGIVSLGDLVDENTGGRIGIEYDGRNDWRYGKHVTVDGNPDRFAYWDGKQWQNAPEAFGTTESFNEVLHGFAIWRDEQGNLEQDQKADFPWPDTDLQEWSEPAKAQLQRQLDAMSTAINDYWSNKFDLRRDQCQGYDPHCCRIPIECDVSFVEVPRRVDRSIIITENDIRANSDTWPLTMSSRTAIHEFGHHLGNPDEYSGAGSVNMYVNSDGAVLGIDDASIMGTGTIARRRHFDSIAEALAQLVEQELGVMFTFTPVEHLPEKP